MKQGWLTLKMKGTVSQPSQGTFCCSQIFHFAFSKPPFCGLRWWGHRTVPTQPALTLGSASTWICRCLDPILPQAPCTPGGGCQDSPLMSGCDSEHCCAAEAHGETLSESLLGARNSFLPEATLVLGTATFSSKSVVESLDSQARDFTGLGGRSPGLWGLSGPCPGWAREGALNATRMKQKRGAGPTALPLLPRSLWDQPSGGM